VQRAPTAAYAAARAFIDSYLRLTYGHPRAQLVDATPLLVRYLSSSSQPSSPPNGLRPRIGSLSLEQSGRGWEAVAAVSDGAGTYVLSCAMVRVGAGWEASSVRVG
jgi:hypothetical protein